MNSGEEYNLKIEGVECSLPNNNVQYALEDIVTFFNDNRQEVANDLKMIRDNWCSPLGREIIFSENNGLLFSLQKAIHLLVMLDEGIGDVDFG